MEENKLKDVKEEEEGLLCQTRKLYRAILCENESLKRKLKETSEEKDTAIAELLKTTNKLVECQLAYEAEVTQNSELLSRQQKTFRDRSPFSSRSDSSLPTSDSNNKSRRKKKYSLRKRKGSKSSFLSFYNSKPVVENNSSVSTIDRQYSDREQKEN